VDGIAKVALGDASSDSPRGGRPASALACAAWTLAEGEAMELRVGLDELLPIKEASRTLAHAVDRLERHEAEHLVITKRSKPSAVIVGLSRYEDLLRGQSEERAA
jgi:prevent-host-death family protein